MSVLVRKTSAENLNSMGLVGNEECSGLKKKLEELERDCRTLKKAAEINLSDFKNFKKSELGLQKQLRDQAAEISMLQGVLRSQSKSEKCDSNIRLQCDSQVRELKRLLAETVLIESKINERQELIVELKQESKHEVSEVKTLKKAVESLIFKFEHQGGELKSVRNCVEKLQMEIEKGHREKEQYKNKEDPDSKLRIRTLKQITIRAEGLENYADILRRSKHDMVLASKQLAQEILVSSNIQPLRDFHSLTEKEILKLEYILRKIQLRDPNRIPMEKSLELLIEQRELLSSVIRSSENQLRREADQVLKLVAGGIA